MRWVLLREYFADLCMVIACSIFFSAVIFGVVDQIFGKFEQRTAWLAFYVLFPTLFVVFYRGLTKGKGLCNAWNGIVVEEEPEAPRYEWVNYILAGGFPRSSMRHF